MPNVGKWMVADYVGPSPSGLTHVWQVRSHDRSLLGEIRWLPRWREYVFYPQPHTIWSPTCLNDISEFTQRLTKEHRSRIRTVVDRASQ